MRSFNKAIMIMIVLLVFFNCRIFAYTNNDLLSDEFRWDRNISIFLPVANEELLEQDIVNLVKRYVPEKYVDCFLYYTYDEDKSTRFDLRSRILSTGWVETEWKNVVSKINTNGTRDYGYLQLNSGNIKNAWFMEKYGPKNTDEYIRDISDKTELYLIVCINYYKSLYTLYGGDDAFYAYNCGEPRYLKNRIPASTIAYRNKILKKLRNIEEEIEDIRAKRIDETNQMMRELYMNIQMSKLNKLMQEYAINYISRVNLKLNDTLFINDEDDMDKIIEELKSYPISEENLNYRYVGIYKRNTGAIAPVFKNISTGKVLYC